MIASAFSCSCNLFTFSCSCNLFTFSCSCNLFTFSCSCNLFTFMKRLHEQLKALAITYADLSFLCWFHTLFLIYLIYIYILMWFLLSINRVRMAYNHKTLYHYVSFATFCLFLLIILSCTPVGQICLYFQKGD